MQRRQEEGWEYYSQMAPQRYWSKRWGKGKRVYCRCCCCCCSSNSGSSSHSSTTETTVQKSAARPTECGPPQFWCPCSALPPPPDCGSKFWGHWGLEVGSTPNLTTLLVAFWCIAGATRLRAVSCWSSRCGAACAGATGGKEGRGHMCLGSCGCQQATLIVTAVAKGVVHW